MDPDIRILEPFNLLPAAMAVREQGEGVAGDLVQDRIVVVAGEWHRETR
jgi:hypothetical protein